MSLAHHAAWGRGAGREDTRCSCSPRSFFAATPVGFEPTRGHPIGLASRRLSHSAKVSSANLAQHTQREGCQRRRTPRGARRGQEKEGERGRQREREREETREKVREREGEGERERESEREMQINPGGGGGVLQPGERARERERARKEDTHRERERASERRNYPARFGQGGAVLQQATRKLRRLLLHTER